MSGPCHEIVDDIEDLISSQDITPKERYSFRRKKLTDSKRSKEEDLIIPEAQIYSSIIPGTQAIYIKTWGCTHNSSDGEYMAGQLAAYGYNLTDNKYIANLWLLNSCTVKGPAEDHFRNEIEAGKKLGKHIVAAGCVPQGAPKSTFIQDLSVIGVNQIDRIVEVVEETLKGNTVRFLKKQREGKKIEVPLFLPKIRRNPLIEIIAINTGCLNQCTYCKTKHARGELGSYNPKDIVERATQAFEEGVREIWITSEDTGAYGRDIGTNLPELLRKLIEVVPDGCRLRVGMTNPPYILEHLEEISQILQHPKVYSFLHIPVQCGSDKVLFDMKREYTRLDFEHIVNFLRTRIPKINIATDIICGFPSETDQDFQETVDLCKKYKFSSLFINQFFPRPGTPAAVMTQIPKQEIKKRTKILSDFFQSYEPYSKKVGEIQNILVTEVAHDKKHYVGHNCYYEQVLVPKNKEFLGKIIKVKIVSASKHSLRGEPLPEENLKTVPQEKVFYKLLSIAVLHKLQLSALVIITVAIIVKVLWKFFTKF